MLESVTVMAAFKNLEVPFQNFLSREQMENLLNSRRWSIARNQSNDEYGVRY